MSVTALKAVCLLLNLRDTFKALKRFPRRRLVPALEDDDGHAEALQAVPRISAARRERLRETLMIWVVWYAWIYTELVLDWVIGWIMPFYTQFKLLVLLYLISTRSFGASGIYSHLLKPIIDIYAPPIDLTMLLLSHTLDLLIAVILRAPLDLAHSLISSMRSKPKLKEQSPVQRSTTEIQQTIRDGQVQVGQKAKELRDLRTTGAVRQRARLLEKTAVAATATPAAPGAFRVYPDVPRMAPAPRVKALPKFPSLPPTLYDFNTEMDKRQSASTSTATQPAAPPPKLVLKPKVPANRKTVSAPTGRPKVSAQEPSKAPRKRKVIDEPNAEGAAAPVIKKPTASRSAPARLKATMTTPAKKRKLNDGDAEYIDEREEPAALPKRTPRRKAAIAAAEALTTPKPKPRAKRKPRE